MLDLIARLERAKVADRRLDESIAFAIQWRPQTRPSKISFEQHEAKHGYQTAWIAHEIFRSEWPIPAYTASIDAALTLVPDDMGAVVNTICFVEVFPKTIRPEELYVTFHVRHEQRPVLALCIAALKARAALSVTRSIKDTSSLSDTVS